MPYSVLNSSTRSSLVLFSVVLILTLGNSAVQAQSSLHEAPAAASPNSEQSSPSPDDIPAHEAPVEPAQPLPLRRFVGIGGNVGLGGEDIGLSEDGFAIITRQDLNDRLSIRSTNIFGNTRNDNAMALTVNFPVRSRSGEVKLIPFVGGGVLVSSKSLFEDVLVRGLVTGGVDLPLSRRFTATTAVDVGFIDTTSVGLQLGLMYGF